MKISHFFQTLCLSAAVCAAGYIHATETPTAAPRPTPATAPSVIPAMPELAAKSYVLMDAASGNILVEHNGDERLPPASLTKLMTSYVLSFELEAGRVHNEDMVNISKTAWAQMRRFPASA